MTNNATRNKLLPLALLLSNILPANAQCEPCDLVPNGFTVRPGTDCLEYINCLNGAEANVQTCSGGTKFDLTIGEFHLVCMVIPISAHDTHH